MTMPGVTTGLAAGDIAAIIVLYHPDAGVISNVSAIAAQVDHIFAVDNTEAPDPAFVEVLRATPGLTYVPMGDNLGIAAALNRGVEQVRDASYPWALTMDQDGTPESDMVAALCRCAETCETTLPIGILAPMHVRHGGPEVKHGIGCHSTLTAMTSGNLLNCAAWEAIGGFDEGLFIDSVDHEFCLRLHRSGHAVMRCREARLLHRLGETTRHDFIVTAYASNHSPLRRYYITRNVFEVTRRFREDYPEFRRREMRRMRRELGKIVAYEDHKAAKLLMAWRGYLDYRRGVTGRYTR